MLALTVPNIVLAVLAVVVLFIFAYAILTGDTTYGPVSQPRGRHHRPGLIPALRVSA